MEKNEGTLDRIIRLVLGLALIAAAYSMHFNTAGIVLTIIGIVLLFTAATGFCAIYKIFKVSTR